MIFFFHIAGVKKKKKKNPEIDFIADRRADTYMCTVHTYAHIHKITLFIITVSVADAFAVVVFVIIAYIFTFLNFFLNFLFYL